MVGGVPPGPGEAAAPAGVSRSGQSAPLVCLLAAVLVLAAATSVRAYRPLTYLVGDCPYYAATAVSLIEDRDLDLRNQLRGGLEVHGRQIALGRDGAWYPKHPILMPLAALPLVLLFGIPGTLVFNLLVFAGLAILLQRLATPAAPAWPAALASFVLLFGTFMREYIYNFSPDLFATLVLTAAWLALQRERDRQGGALLGLAVMAKLTHLFLLPLGLAYVWWCRGRKAAASAALGAAGPLVALAILNSALFGSPFVTSYDRNVVIDEGVAVTVSHRGLFDGAPLSGLQGELLDPIHGLLPTAPALLLAVPGFLILVRRRPREAVLHLAVGEFLLLFFATYRYWALSHAGNRFLMPLVAVAAPSVAVTIERIGEMLRRAWSARAASAAMDASS